MLHMEERRRRLEIDADVMLYTFIPFLLQWLYEELDLAKYLAMAVTRQGFVTIS